MCHFFLKLATSDSPVAPSSSRGTLVNCSRVALCGSSVWPVVSPCGHYLAFEAGSVSGLEYLCLGGCLAAPLGVHPLDASGTPPSFHNQNTSRFGQMSPSAENYCWESHNRTAGCFLFRNHIPAPRLFAVEPRAILRVLHFARSDPPLARKRLREI